MIRPVMKGVPLVIYRLPQVIAAARAGQTIWLAEGERDVHALELAGAVATTSSGGAGKWRARYAGWFRGAAEVVIVQDRDEPGRAHAQQELAGFDKEGIPARIVEAREGHDAREHLKAGRGLEDFVPVARSTSGPPPPDTASPAGSRATARSSTLRARPDAAAKGQVGARLLADLVTFVLRFVVMSVEQARAWALWVLHTHAIDAAQTTGYLSVMSPAKRSGKTRLLEVADLVVARPLMAADCSVAALARLVDRDQVTLLLDEVDAIFKRGRDQPEGAEQLRGILSAGHRRGARYVRMVGQGAAQEPVGMEVFSATAFAGIGKVLPDTVGDRSIRIALQRRARREKVDRFNRRRTTAQQYLQRHPSDPSNLDGNNDGQACE